MFPISFGISFLLLKEEYNLNLLKTLLCSIRNNKSFTVIGIFLLLLSYLSWDINLPIRTTLNTPTAETTASVIDKLVNHLEI